MAIIDSLFVKKTCHDELWEVIVSWHNLNSEIFLVNACQGFRVLALLEDTIESPEASVKSVLDYLAVTLIKRLGAFEL